MVTFDTALEEFAGALVRVTGTSSVLTKGLFLRDGNGRLAFVLPDENVGEFLGEAASKLVSEVVSGLAGYAFGPRPILGKDDLLDPNALKSEPALRVTIAGVDGVRVIDRRIVGQDWLRQPVPGWSDGEPGRLAFCSLKGGVGRTTALALLAADLVAKGKRVLALDLDLEAPGLSSVLLREEDLPEFGSLDWFVENGISSISGQFLDGLTAVSSVVPGAGVLYVVPATGRKSDAYPQNVLSKLARAYLEDNKEGASISFLGQAAQLVEHVLAFRPADVVLIDARAGLNESTAAAVLGLGADVLLFGVDTPQTFSGYRYLLSHLRLVSPTDEGWRLRLKMIHAKASTSEAAQKAFRDKAYDLFAEFIYDTDADSEELESALVLGIDDVDAPHFAWPVLDDANYREFNPIAAGHLFTDEFYSRTYGRFLQNCRQRLAID